MNYNEWSDEYMETANELEAVIDRLNKRRRTARLSDKKELEKRIVQYRQARRECLEIAAILRHRSGSAA